MIIRLRDYQLKAIEQITSGGKRKPTLLVAPTGSGKTVMVAESLAHLGMSAVAICHRVEIRRQIEKAFDASGVEGRAISNLNNRIKKLIKDYDALFIDEAHHMPAETFLRAYELAKKHRKFIIGATATPYRSDKVDISRYFSKYVSCEAIGDLVLGGHIAKVKYHTASSVDFKQIKRIRRDDLKEQDAFNQVRVLVQAGDVCAAWSKYAKNKGALIYCCNQQHVDLVKAELDQAGMKNESITSKTGSTERKDIVAKFESMKIRAIVNCMVLSEGADIKNVGCIIMLRPTASRSLYKQMIGRGMRPDCECSVIDLVGNYELHGDVMDEDPEHLFQTSKLLEAAKNDPHQPDITKATDLDIVKVHAKLNTHWMPQSIMEAIGNV